MEIESSDPAKLTRTDRKRLVWSLIVSFFWTICVWGFWEAGVFAFGINVAVYLMIMLGLFLHEAKHHHVSIKEQAYWIVPVGLMILSFAFYDNPFLKGFSILLLPSLFAFFYNYTFLKEKEKAVWNASFLAKMFERCAGFLGTLGTSLTAHLRLITFPTKHGGVVKRVIIGLSLLLIISAVVIIPVLSSADSAFAESVQGLMAWIRTLVSASILQKLAVGLGLSWITLATVLAWSRPFSHEEKAQEEKRLDPIITGIVLGGILFLYLLFLWLQVKHLWTGTLPFRFEDAEQLVKGGFWQLLFLSAVNIGFYFFVYRKTVPSVQKLLAVFTVASLFLLVSAAQRMVLYVTTYGFSYEKFFASYAVLFCAIVFVWLIFRLFVSKRADILKFSAILFLWMYALVTVFPVEQFVMRMNVKLAEQPESRIRLYELTMLSPDVLGLVEDYQKTGQLVQEPVVYQPQFEGDIAVAVDEQAGWKDWVTVQKQLVEDKAWYEMNLTNVLYKLGR